jgi:hypothetical protein
MYSGLMAELVVLVLGVCCAYFTIFVSASRLFCEIHLDVVCAWEKLMFKMMFELEHGSVFVEGEYLMFNASYS